jgi:hypothetical protein
MAGSFEHGSETLYSKKRCEFVDQISECQNVKKNCFIELGSGGPIKLLLKFYEAQDNFLFVFQPWL